MWYNLICNGRASSKDFLFMTNVNKLSDLKFAVLKLDDNASYYDSFVISNDVEGHIELFVNCETGECALTCMAARESWDSEEYKIPWDELNAFLDIYRELSNRDPQTLNDDDRQLMTHFENLTAPCYYSSLKLILMRLILMTFIK